MKIIWNKNPLHTVIELDEFEKKEFWYKIKIKELEEKITSAYFTLDHHEWYNKTVKPQTLEETISEAKKLLNPSYVCNEDEYEHKGIDAKVQQIFEHYMKDLAGSHFGDCICVACPCSKCHAEEILGINTIKDLPKHSAHKINNAFGKENERSIDEVLEYLKNYVPKADWKGWEAHADRWIAEAKAAYDWLLVYRQTHPEIISS